MTRRNTMLTIFTKIKEFFIGKPQAPVVEAPYKVEAPVAAQVPERKVFSVDVGDVASEKALAIVSSVSEQVKTKSVAPTLKIVHGSTPKVSSKPRERAKPKPKPKAKPVAAQPAKPKSKGQASSKPTSKTAQKPKK